MISSIQSEESARFADWPLAVKSILGFWAFYGLTVVARAFLTSDPGTVMFNRLVTTVLGIVLTFGVYAAIRTFAANASLKRGAIVAGISSVLAALTLAVMLLALDRHLDKPQDQFRFTSREGYEVIEQGHQMRVSKDGEPLLVLSWPRVAELQRRMQFRIAADSTVVWVFFFAAWSAFYLAVHAQAQALTAQKRAAEAEGAAQSAQLRALRYQVNPHFLFNTLNSLSSLIMARRPEEAEEMILKLSTFFRSSLSLDPADDVTLAEEIGLQRLYLDIEKVRFPKRLKVEIDVPQNLESARLPALLLQPLVENAIKYGVSQTREKVTLRISAREAGPARLRIEVANHGGKPVSPRSRQEPPESTGVGLANVCQRLAARFGPSATCEYGPTDDGGYRVAMTMPFERANG